MRGCTGRRYLGPASEPTHLPRGLRTVRTVHNHSLQKRHSSAYVRAYVRNILYRMVCVRKGWCLHAQLASFIHGTVPAP